MSIRGLFKKQKYALLRATKIIKNQGGDILLFGQKNIARYISAQQQNSKINNDQVSTSM